jgi:hypothetical protein
MAKISIVIGLILRDIEHLWRAIYGMTKELKKILIPYIWEDRMIYKQMV